MGKDGAVAGGKVTRPAETFVAAMKCPVTGLLFEVGFLFHQASQVPLSGTMIAAASMKLEQEGGLLALALLFPTRIVMRAMQLALGIGT